ncbi:MAG: hypothetical protein LC667_19600, partial [Thioalkalivibrio sp.]|nr:hypothetical protein [Thioalkalivibrio sp.]
MPDRENVRLPQRRPLGGHAAVAAILVVLIASAAAVVFFVTRDREVAAPELLGMSLTEAAAVAD